MRIAFFDIVSGISGDMTLGACVGAGVPFDQLVAELRKLPLDGYRIEMREVIRSMISAIKIDVILEEKDHSDEKDHSHENNHSHDHDHSLDQEHSHETDHSHDHDHSHDQVHSNAHDQEHSHAHDQKHSHAHDHEHSHAHHPRGRQRGYVEIVALIDSSTLGATVKDRAKAMFLNLARAEATVHHTTIEQVHFHEVGAVDSIIDIVGTAICIELLGVDRVYSTPVRTGSGGVIQTQHGAMPIPAPATVELLKDYPIELTSIPHELTTPTGATIIATLSSGVLEHDTRLRVHAVGYGAGSKEFTGLPNMLRLVVGEIDLDAEDEKLILLETNIDDMNPELYPYVLERLLAEGAHDAWLAPVLMKKGRPAHVLSVLADEAKREELLAILMNETSTTGVRMQPVTRRKLPRTIERVPTAFGEVAVKVITRGGTVTRVPEFEECRRIAQERNLPLIEVYRQIEIDLRETGPGHPTGIGNSTPPQSLT